MNFKKTIFIAVVFWTLGAAAEDFTFADDISFGSAIGRFVGAGDPQLQKKLATSVGKTIRINRLNIATISVDEWRSGGKLHLFSGKDGDNEYRVTCSLPKSVGDMYIADRRGPLVVTGKIASYNKIDGLVIDPCNAIEYTKTGFIPQ